MAAKQSVLAPPADDPQPTVRWVVVYDDRFDREARPSEQVQGIGLVPGLAELWARFLFETVQTATSWRDGKAEEIPTRGFSEFQLEIGDAILELQGSLAGAYRLKKWMFPVPFTSGVIENAETRLLRALAEAHASSGEIQSAALAILDAAEAASDRETFEVSLGELRRIWGR